MARIEVVSHRFKNAEMSQPFDAQGGIFKTQAYWGDRPSMLQPFPGLLTNLDGGN
jgi:hypothetical protein